MVQPCNFADKLLLHEREDSKLKTSLQISELELQNFEGLSPINLLARQVSLYSENTGSHGADAMLFEFPKKAAGGSLGASRSSKTFP